MQSLQYIKYGSAKKTALYYLKMKNEAVSFASIFNFVKHYKQRPFRIKEGLVSMQAEGLISEVQTDMWQITPLGINAVYELGKRDKGRDQSRDRED